MPDLRRSVCLALATCLAVPSIASAKNDEQGRPWARGTWSIGPGFGFSLGSDVTSLSFGVSGEYYVLHGWSFGADISDTVFIYSSALKSEFPGIHKELANNAFFFIPQSRYVFYRSYRFSPWVLAGVGPVALNHGGGAAGQWVAAPGAYIGLAGPVYLSLSVTFSQIFTRGVCEDAFTSEPHAVEMRGVCGFQWSPGIGITIAPRGKTRRERREEERRRRAPPPANPMRFEPAPAPVEPAPVEPAPVEPVPAEPAPVTPEPAPAPTEGSESVAPDPAEPPVEGPAPAPASDPADDVTTPDPAATEAPTPGSSPE